MFVIVVGFVVVVVVVVVVVIYCIWCLARELLSKMPWRMMSQGAATKGTLAGMTGMTNRQIIATSTQLSPRVGSFERHIPLISKGRIQVFFDTSYFSPCLPFWTIFRSNQSHHVLMIKQDANIFSSLFIKGHWLAGCEQHGHIMPDPFRTGSDLKR